jgi:hypothetical protein
MLNLYAITRDTIRPCRHYEYAENITDAIQQFRKYWNRPVESGRVSVHLVRENVEKPFGGESCNT